jgi:hypothetical protein
LLSSDAPFVSPAFALFFLPKLLLPPTVVAASRSTLVDAGMGESVLLLAFFVRTAEEDTVAPDALRLS